jgi:hypothetical protein
LAMIRFGSAGLSDIVRGARVAAEAPESSIARLGIIGFVPFAGLWMVLSAVSDTLTYISDSTINIYGTIVVTVHDARCDTS